MAQPTSEALQDLSPQELALSIARMLDARQGEDIVILDVSGPLVIADYFVIATARNARHAAGMAQEVDFTLKHAGRLRRNISGAENECPWVLLDFNEVVLHVFVGEAREFYGLENLWADVPRVEFTPDPDAASRAPVEDDGADQGDTGGGRRHLLRPEPLQPDGDTDGGG